MGRISASPSNPEDIFFQTQNASQQSNRAVFIHSLVSINGETSQPQPHFSKQSSPGRRKIVWNNVLHNDSNASFFYYCVGQRLAQNIISPGLVFVSYCSFCQRAQFLFVVMCIAYPLLSVKWRFGGSAVGVVVLFGCSITMKKGTMWLRR